MLPKLGPHCGTHGATEEQQKDALKDLTYDWSDVSEDEGDPGGEFVDGIWSDTDSGSGSDTGGSIATRDRICSR